jgi:hypothetical protein
MSALLGNTRYDVNIDIPDPRNMAHVFCHILGILASVLDTVGYG